MGRHKFPVYKTKIKGVKQSFDLADRGQRLDYFRAKGKASIAKIEDYLNKGGTFVGFLMGKKGSGKGTRAKIFADIFGREKIAHIGIGDIVRLVHEELETEEGKKELVEYLKQDYRGYISIEKGIEAILGRSQDRVSVPDELMLSLIKWEIDKHEGKALFIDGFPRTLDQVSYSLYFRDLMGYRDDPDFFVLVDVPEGVIDARIKNRVVCPECKAPRGLSFMPTKLVGCDEKGFYLMCDNPECRKARMMSKEGDDKGIESIRSRLDDDGALLDKAFSLHGVPKVLLRNSVPLDDKSLVDEYEITPEFYYEEKDEKVITKTRPWVVKDDDGVDSYSLLPEPNVLVMIEQIAEIL